jgi:hypothetical protein
MRQKIVRMHSVSMCGTFRLYEIREVHYFFHVNPLTPELNLFAQRCLTRFFTGDFSS